MNRSTNKTNQLFIPLKNNSSNRGMERLNTNKTIESKKIVINCNNKKELKKLKINDILNNAKINPKYNYNILSSKGNKENINIKKIFIEHFATEANQTISNNNISSFRKKTLYPNNQFNKKGKKKIIKTENSINTSLSELLKKIRQTKTKLDKNNKINQKPIVKINSLL